MSKLRPKSFHSALFLLGTLGLSGIGCDRCSRTETATPGADGAPSTATPVIMMVDGGHVRAEAVITEALASKVAGPTPSGGKISGATTPMAVECKSPGQPVSPTIFGIAWADT